jgi:hypothetical protein
MHMSAAKWAALPAITAGLLTGEVAVATAAEPVPTPTPTPALTPTSTPASTDAPAVPDPPTPDIPAVSSGTVVYLVTTTTTTTIVNAPITVVAAPITTTVNNTTPAASQPPVLRPQRLVLDLTGCGQATAPSPLPRRARVRLARNAQLVVRVNHRRVAALQLPSHGRRGVPLRVRVARNGMLTIRRPSGRIVSVQGCSPN